MSLFVLLPSVVYIPMHRSSFYPFILSLFKTLAAYFTAIFQIASKAGLAGCPLVPYCIGLSRYIAITNLSIIAVFVEYLRQFLIDLHQIYRHGSVPQNTSP